ncbi:hypothetical protein ACFY1L_08550 [Streptomyces sp. NPDC001663]|uniref:hypothetical protein n=1 Tax=Streptomyces sp. NPDC001663 TaxID=3364597 RepID=UPI00368F8153
MGIRPVRLAGLAQAAVALVVCGAPVAGAVDGTDRSDGAVAAVRAQGRDIPDLAMVVTGGSARTTALRSGEPEFARLWQLLQPTYTGTQRVPQAWAEGRYPPVRITVVWGLTGVGGWPQTNRAPGGDVAVEREDQLFEAEDGSPWVRTDPAPDVEDDDIRWHRAPRSAYERLALSGLLDMSEQQTVGDGSSRSRTGPDDGSLWWAVPGLALGVAVGAGGTLLIRRAAARQGAGPPREEPRQELIDL